MSERSGQILIKTMLDYINDILEFTNGEDYSTFLADKKTRYAVLRALGVLGEAANRIPKGTRQEYANIEWGRIIRSRNLIIHEYEIVDYEVVWRIVTIHLPILRNALQQILKDLEP
jgi:uncharacterized protein with HEPN domain